MRRDSGLVKIKLFRKVSKKYHMGILMLNPVTQHVDKPWDRGLGEPGQLEEASRNDKLSEVKVSFPSFRA